VTERTPSAPSSPTPKNNSGLVRNAWGGALVLGAASVMMPALLLNLPSLSNEWARWGHEAPVVTAIAPIRTSQVPEPATPAPPAQAIAATLTLSLEQTLTDPDDTRDGVTVHGQVWVATGGGLLRFDPSDPGEDRWWTTADGLPDHRLTAIAAYGDGLALGTEGGSVITLGLPGDDGRLDVRSVDAISESRISDLLGEGELLWVATWGDGAFSGVPGTPMGFAALGPSRGMRARQLTGIARLGDELVAGTAGAGLWVRKDAGSSRLYVSRGGLISDFLLDVERVGDRVIAAGPGGISRYRNGVLETVRGGDRIPAGVVRTVGSHDGRARFSLAGGQLARYGSTSTEMLPAHPDGLGPWHGVPLPEIRWMAQVGEQRVAGTARGILHGTDELQWRTHGGPGSNDLTSVSADGGSLLVGTFDGGAWLRSGDGAFDSWRALPAPSGEINDVHLDAGVAWLGTSRGLARVQGGALRSWGITQGLRHEHVGAIAPSPDGLLVGTTAGVQRFDGVGFSPVGGEGSESLRNVYSVVATGDGAWVGSLEGAWALGDQGATRFRYETGELPDSWVNAVAVGPDGRLWAGTYDRGIATRTPDGAWASFTEADGLPCGWVNPDALLALPDGTALVGTMGGGLLRVGPTGALDQWTAQDGLAGDDVTGLTRDGDVVWIATRSGLSRILITEEVAHVADRS